MYIIYKSWDKKSGRPKSAAFKILCFGNCRGVINHLKLLFTVNKSLGNDDLLYILLGGKLIHGLHHQSLNNGSETSCTDLALYGKMCDSSEGLLLNLKLDAVKREQLLILLLE